MWDSAGNWIGLSVWIDTAPWWVRAALGVFDLGLMVWLVTGCVGVPVPFASLFGDVKDRRGW